MRFSHALACVLLLSLTACAPLQPDGISGGMQNSQERWNAFLAQRGQEGPSLAEGSLRFGESGNTHRVTWLLWGNDAAHLRFDIQVGMGNTLAKARLTDDELLLYLPGDNRALRGTDAPEGILRRIGLDLPLSLHELYSVIQGDFSSALSHSRILSSRNLESGNIELEIGTDSPRMPRIMLELDGHNLPVRWQIPRAWDIRIRYGEDALPRRIDGTRQTRMNDEEYRLILLIKTRQIKEGFPEKDLELTLPANVQFVSGI